MTIILFFVSLCALFALVALRVFEVKFKKVDFLQRLWTAGDEKIVQFFDKAVWQYNRYKKISHIFLFEFVPSYIYEVLVKTKDYVSKRYYNAGEGFRGRRMLRGNGSVSFFLERLADDKNR